MRTVFLLLAALGLCFLQPVKSEQFVAADGIQIHYSAVSAANLPAAMASLLGIKRAKNQALLHVSVLRMDADSGLGQAIEGQVKASAINSTGARQNIAMRRMADAGTVSYVGIVRVADRDTLEFSLDVRPEGSSEPVAVAFSQQFFVD
ncbi:MAG: DUF4426 domain-containing protein [Pseudomonadota bacterium]